MRCRGRTSQTSLGLCLEEDGGGVLRWRGGIRSAFCDGVEGAMCGVEG